MPWMLSDRRFVELVWELKYGSRLDLDNPKTFNEKIQWLKVFDRRKDYFMMADKIEAKKYVAQIIGREHIIPTIAVYDRVQDIIWEDLPQQFVVKCSHNSGGLAVCRNKELLDKKETVERLSACLKKNYFYQSGEWCYKGIKPRILCEQLMEDDSQRESLIDYKFFCFGGQPEFVYISYGLEDHSTASISFVDIDGERAPFHRADYKEVADPLPIPASFEEMKHIAARIAKAVNNAFVRVDLYEINGNIYFSELTFYPNGGYIPFVPAEWDNKLGELLQL